MSCSHVQNLYYQTLSIYASRSQDPLTSYRVWLLRSNPRCKMALIRPMPASHWGRQQTTVASILAVARETQAGPRRALYMCLGRYLRGFAREYAKAAHTGFSLAIVPIDPNEYTSRSTRNQGAPRRTLCIGRSTGYRIPFLDSSRAPIPTFHWLRRRGMPLTILVVARERIRYSGESCMYVSNITATLEPLHLWASNGSQHRRFNGQGASQ